MSDKKVKLKKQRKPMSPQAKRSLGLTFKSLLSNQACVDGAKEAPWWIGVIFLVLSICLPVIPITVNLSKAYGSSFVSTYNYGSDRGLANTSKAYKADGYDFVLENDGLMHYYKGAEEISANVVKDDIYVDTLNVTQVYNFRLYITDTTGEELTNLTKSIDALKYVKGTLDKFEGEVTDENKSTLYTPSYGILAPDTMLIVLYKNQSLNKAGSTYSGLNWVNTPKGSLLDRVLKVSEGSTEPVVNKEIYDNWKSVLDETFIYTKNIQMRNQSLLYLGVYAGLVAFLGLMLFLLTRGKNNPFHYLNLFVTEKIAWWASFTPAVLGMILGFILSGNIIGQMGFIVLVSLRVMWLSMRQLRPM